MISSNPSFRRLLSNAVFWALEPRSRPTPIETGDELPFDSRPQGPLSPAQALAAFQVPDDLRVDLVLAEPVVRQPVSLSFDERGRLWVVQYLQYPFPAGLKMVSHDGVWRAVYDKVPAPPPHHVRGKDKITIHEDTDGDGVFDRHKTFVEGLNIATSALARQRGRLGAQSAVSALLSRPEQRRRARRRPRGPPSGVRPGRHAFGREQPALGTRRLDLRGPGLDRDRPRHASGSRCRARSPCTRWAN